MKAGEDLIYRAALRLGEEHVARLRAALPKAELPIICGSECSTCELIEELFAAAALATMAEILATKETP